MFRLRHLTPGTTHTFAVRARDTSGNLSGRATPSPSRSSLAATVTPPSTPTNLTATQPDDDFCGTNWLQWVASTDDVDPPSAIEYEIYLNGSLRMVTPPGVAWARPPRSRARTPGPSSPSIARATARARATRPP